ncbi:MAG: cyclic nucleotide-binding domain-containing protein [Ilumatobacteraceae bacterium]
MSDMLALSAHLPEIRVDVGHVLCTEGDAGGPIWVLVDGSLSVTKVGTEMNSINHAGSVIGEIAVLTGSGLRRDTQVHVRSRRPRRRPRPRPRCLPFM